MESLLVMAALFFVVGPIVMLFLLLGMRSRLATLERQVKELQAQLQWLYRHAEARISPAVTATPEVSETPLVEAGMAPSEPVRVAKIASAPAESPVAAVQMEFDPASDPGSAPLPSWGKEPAIESEPLIQATPAEPEPTHQCKDEARDLPAPPRWLAKAREWLFGGNLVAKIGLLILFFGVSFLLKYAAARVSVPIEFRLAGIVLADIGLLLWGWRIRHSRPSISLPVQGGAMGILILVTFAAFRLYDLIPGGLAFGLLLLLTFFTCLLAVLQDAVWLAVFGIVGGFAAPILTSTGHGSHVALFSYYALLNAGILAIALKRSWRLLNLLGFVFTFLVGTTWGVLRYQPENYLSVQAFLVLFFVFYVAIAILYATRQAPRLRHYVDGTLVFGTPLLAFGLQYGLVHETAFGMAFSALALGLFYIGLTFLLWRRRADSLKLLVESFLALGIVFGTLAIPFALDGRWTAAAWALEGAGIVWVGLRQKQTLAWVFGVLVQLGAWVSFIGSVHGLAPEIAAQSNLWLGFLLLAITAFLMAISFRKETSRVFEETEGAAGKNAILPMVILTWLSTIFLGFAAIWLLVGTWNEIWLRGGKQMTNLLVLSALAVAGLLLVIARRLDWGVSRIFSLVPHALVGAAFLVLMDSGRIWESRPMGNKLFETDFLGALLIAVGAAFTGLVFHRQPLASHRRISRLLLGWSAFCWFIFVLGIFNAWVEQILARYNLFVETGYPRVHPLYGVLVALGTPGFIWLSRRQEWPDLRWLATAVWPALLLVLLGVFQQLHGSPPYIPGLPVWIVLIALWLASEWLLRDGERASWLLPAQHPKVLRSLHTLRTVGPWLILWPLVQNLVLIGLRIDSAEQGVLLAGVGWSAAIGWSRYLPAWVAMACLALLIPRARNERWPTWPVAGWYRDVLLPLGALYSLALVVVWNLTQDGVMAPLPYLPILNPLDLTTGFAALLAISAWRLRGKPEGGALARLTTRLPQLLMVAAYAWFNLMLLRTAAHFLAIPYRAEPLFHSQFVQAMLALVWSTSALVLMRVAARQRQRALWMAGAALLALVVFKLFMVDLSNVGGIERIISFLGVGILMLAIGYLAPFPSAKSTATE
ncbi:DUF2339 domain-containing protein [Accumulibacter sp.]|uniref:DUF2339 domain-containing protein n=1 Tax=Accumulibacter sp. TaxID=2053492 RepID=UPI00258E6D82|nr:DUF2339 domain-containing protein [Accumulibacter sp.]